MNKLSCLLVVLLLLVFAAPVFAQENTDGSVTSDETNNVVVVSNETGSASSSASNETKVVETSGSTATADSKNVVVVNDASGSSAGSTSTAVDTTKNTVAPAETSTANTAASNVTKTTATTTSTTSTSTTTSTATVNSNLDAKCAEQCKYKDPKDVDYCKKDCITSYEKQDVTNVVQVTSGSSTSAGGSTNAVVEDPTYVCVKEKCMQFASEKPEEYATCKAACYGEKYGEQNCKEMCEEVKDEKTGEMSKVCKKYCNIESANSGGIAPTATTASTTTTMVDKLGECVSSCPTDEKNYAPCKEECMKKHQYEQACKKVCKKNEEGKKECGEICPGAVVKVDDKPYVAVSVASNPDDKLWQCISSNCLKESEDSKGYASCKEKCYTLVMGETKCKEVCDESKDENGKVIEKVCKKYCDVQAVATATAPESAVSLVEIPVEKDPVLKCVMDSCSGVVDTSSEKYAQCKKECYNKNAPAPVKEAVKVCATGDAKADAECMKTIRIRGIKKECEKLEGENRNRCEEKVRNLVLGEDASDYTNWLAQSNETSAQVNAENEKRSQINAEYNTKMGEDANKMKEEANAAALEKMKVTIEKMGERSALLEKASEKAKAKGHDVAELEYLKMKYDAQVSSAKALYAAGNYGECIEALHGAEGLAIVFKSTLKEIVAAHKAGLTYSGSGITPMAKNIGG
ncbi:MAG: hypothetical protein ABIH99_00685 [Candidatus Micrarchaeota archaeon]